MLIYLRCWVVGHMLEVLLLSTFGMVWYLPSLLRDSKIAHTSSYRRAGCILVVVLELTAVGHEVPSSIGLVPRPFSGFSFRALNFCLYS